MDFLHDERQIECSELKVHRARFYAREVQNIVYQRQQQCTVDVDCFDELLYLFRRKSVQILQQIREADNGIQRGAYSHGSYWQETQI